jgi:hypothetical protein
MHHRRELAVTCRPDTIKCSSWLSTFQLDLLVDNQLKQELNSLVTSHNKHEEEDFFFNIALTWN